MPKKYELTFHDVASPITKAITKFGGQPVWVAEPQWPLSRQYGTPMQFLCQIALDAILFGSSVCQMAYLFITDDTEHGFLASTWEPDGGENAVILQPGGTWNGPSLPLVTGPSLYRRRWEHGWQYTPTEFAVELHLGEDAADGSWDKVDPNNDSAWETYMTALFEDKIGGIPVPTVNSSPLVIIPSGDWQLLLQLNTREEPFFLNFADDGVGYVFISHERQQGKFLWLR